MRALMRLDVLLLLFVYCSTSLVVGQNLVVDVTQKGVEKYIRSARSRIENGLRSWKPREMPFSRLLCSVNLQEQKIAKLQMHNFDAPIIAGDYYVKIPRLRFSFKGDYKRKFLFIGTSGTYDAPVEATVTIGPLIPIAYNGLPFIDTNLNCTISVDVQRASTPGYFVRALIENAVRENSRSAICGRLVEILDGIIRDDVARLELHFPVANGVTSLNYRLVRPPMGLPHRQVRFFLDGTAMDWDRPRSLLSPTVNQSAVYDAVFHVHERLFNELAQTLCEGGIFDSNFNASTGEMLSVTCMSADVEFQDGEVLSRGSAGMPRVLRLSTSEFSSDGTNSTRLRSYTVNTYNNSQLEITLRVKAMLAENNSNNVVDPFKHLKVEVFEFVSEAVRDNFLLQLPFARDVSVAAVRFWFDARCLSIGVVVDY